MKTKKHTATHNLAGIFSAIFLALLIAFGAGCATTARPPEITQINTIDSLLAGVYDGHVTFGELRQYGDFGIGTLDKLDGEMMMHNGVAYQINHKGEVCEVDDRVTTPFASVVNFTPQKTFAAAQKDFKGLCHDIDIFADNPNNLVAVSVTGEFATMHTRSVPAQNKPYRPLAEVTKHQPEFTMQNIRGTVVGFRLPAYVKGINVPGYHLHFVSDDKTRGGHVLDFRLASGDVAVCEIYRFRMLLSDDADGFAKADLTQDRTQELHDVESAK